MRLTRVMGERMRRAPWLGGAIAAALVLGTSWAIAEGLAVVDGAASPSWQTLAVSVLAVISAWLQYQARRAQITTQRSQEAIERAIDRLAETVRAQGERLARLEGQHAAHHAQHLVDFMDRHR